MSVLDEVAQQMREEIARRRTFAIISHPDAGKTTLTEKLLLYAGQIEVAGAVRGRKTQRAVTSDWMALERDRGISVSSTALGFEYRGYRLGLLDTPGHQDFSEDTYRTLAAADCAVMVLDVANGVETQTRKLFKVCASRRIPILTLINKMDRLGKDPLDLLAEIERDLGIETAPINWPVGLGPDFQGVVERSSGRVRLFSPGEQGSVIVPSRWVSMSELPVATSEAIAARTAGDLELLDGAGEVFDMARFLAGRQTPVLFASAATNYGIEPFLDAFLTLAPPPGMRRTIQGEVSADSEQFSGQVFKIQANLNPKHRDRVAFVRVCSGRFTPDLEPVVTRSGERLRFKSAHTLFAREREAFEIAYPGDVIGLAFTKGLRLGDTVCVGPPIEYEALPQFSPECFAMARCPDNGRRKQMAEGLAQLADEGAIQLFIDPANSRESILAAVGVLQFDVVKYRLETEYGVKAEIAPMPFKAGAWIGASEAIATSPNLSLGSRLVTDHRNRWVVLVEDEFSIRYLKRQYPQLKLQAFGDSLFAPMAEALA
ncbi:MAG: peptide chain release factor 3 [Planctomycetes bacterium]|nr:peptide chain release factor 3 [Planctomycetota bacterium]